MTQRPRCIWCVLGRHTTTGPLQPWHPLVLVAACQDQPPDQFRRDRHSNRGDR